MIAMTGNAQECVRYNALFENALTVERHVLLVAASATGGDERARRLNAPRGRFEDGHHVGNGKVATGLGDAGSDDLVGKCATNEDNSAAGLSSDRRTAFGHTGCAQLQLLHRTILQ
jgi:hypothetical protein